MFYNVLSDNSNEFALWQFEFQKINGISYK